MRASEWQGRPIGILRAVPRSLRQVYKRHPLPNLREGRAQQNFNRCMGTSHHLRATCMQRRSLSSKSGRSAIECRYSTGPHQCGIQTPSSGLITTSTVRAHLYREREGSLTWQTSTANSRKLRLKSNAYNR